MIQNYSSLNNRNALITGGSSGIGLATAHALSENKVKVVIADIKMPEMEEPGIWFLKADISSPVDISLLHQRVKSAIGVPDILICNAGRGIHEKLSEGDPEKWAEIIEINFLGALRIIRSFLPDMIKEKKGDVVFISSVSAKKAYEWGGVYAATKTAVAMIAETLRLEVQPDIRITTVFPGVVNTGFFTNMMGGSVSQEKMGMTGLSPDDVANAVVYAVSRPKEVAINELVVRPTWQQF
jgi:NADP-dependent 3-hydroxy acid dehydrogenase YdfG